MAVSWVGGGPFVTSFGVPISSTAPAGIEDDDTLLAFLFWREEEPSAPTGWTKLAEISGTNGSILQYLSVWQKDTVTSADALSTVEFFIPFNRAGLLLAAVRGVDTITFGDALSSSVYSYAITPATMTASADGSMLLAVGASILAASGAVAPTGPASFTVFSGASLEAYRLAGAYRLVDTGQANSGTIDFNPSIGSGSLNGMQAFTLLLGPAGSAIPPAEVIVSALSPLRAPVAFGVATVGGPVAAPGPLGAPRARGIVGGAGLASAPTMLGSGRVMALHDFTGQIPGQALRYVMDLVTPSGAVRVPISSWQATLQVDQANYLQCVVPACQDWVEALNAATAFRILRSARLADGVVFEYLMADAPLDTLSTARGTANYTATLSGYSPGAAADAAPPEVTARALQDVRTITTQASGIRVRCAIDWLLRPAQIAIVDGTPFIVAYINYYVSDGDQYMDVGERVSAG